MMDIIIADVHRHFLPRWMHPLTNKGRQRTSSLPSSQQPDSPPKRHSGRPRPRQRSSFTSPHGHQPSASLPVPRGTKATCRPIFNDRRFRFPHKGPELSQSRPTVTYVFSCVPLSWRNENSCFSLPGIDRRNLRLQRFDRLAPPPLSLPLGRKAHPAAAEVAQRVDTPFAKIVENSCSATWSRGAPGPTEQGQIAAQSSSHTSKLSDLSTGNDDTNHTATRLPGSAEKGCLSIYLAGMVYYNTSLRLLALAFNHPEMTHLGKKKRPPSASVLSRPGPSPRQLSQLPPSEVPAAGRGAGPNVDPAEEVPPLVLHSKPDKKPAAPSCGHVISI